jgi:heme/copper-type cytochrome/quinol oxidase subunit 2
MSIPGMPPGPIPGTPGSPEWAAQQLAQQAAQRSMFRRRSITMSSAGAEDGATDVNIHIVPTKGQARARLIIGVAMAIMFVLFMVVFVVVAVHIFQGSNNPGFGN